MAHSSNEEAKAEDKEFQSHLQLHRDQPVLIRSYFKKKKKKKIKSNIKLAYLNILSVRYFPKFLHVEQKTCSYI